GAVQPGGERPAAGPLAARRAGSGARTRGSGRTGPRAAAGAGPDGGRPTPARAGDAARLHAVAGADTVAARRRLAAGGVPELGAPAHVLPVGRVVLRRERGLLAGAVADGGRVGEPGRLPGGGGE